MIPIKRCANCNRFTFRPYDKLCYKCEHILGLEEKECLFCDRIIPAKLVDISKLYNKNINIDDSYFYNNENEENEKNLTEENFDICYFCNDKITSQWWTNKFIENELGRDINENRNHYQYLYDKTLNKQDNYNDIYNNFIKLYLIARTNKNLGDTSLINKLPKDIKNLKNKLNDYFNYKNCIICNNKSDYYLCQECENDVNRIAYSIKDLIPNSSNAEQIFIDLVHCTLHTDELSNDFKKELSKYILAYELIIKDRYYYRKYYNYDDYYLLRYAVEQIKNLELYKSDEETQKIETNTKIKQKNNSYDGHILDSDTEKEIDNVLCYSNILHYIHKQVEEIIEENIISDFFIPIKNGKGIYIEYWGLNTASYKKRKKRKIELYKKYNVPLIEIEKDEPLFDSQNFKSRLIKQIKKISKEFYDCELPEWI